jgi:hypothetical protein
MIPGFEKMQKTTFFLKRIKKRISLSRMNKPAMQEIRPLRRLI